MVLHVKKHPSADTLARCIEAADGTPAPEGFEAMTVSEFEAWRADEIAAGWDPPVEDQEPTEEDIYIAQLNSGYEDATTGIKLKTTERAQAKFTSQVALIQLALSAGAIDGQTAQTFFDFSDAAQQLTTADFLALMLRYGAHCQYLFINYAP